MTGEMAELAGDAADTRAFWDRRKRGTAESPAAGAGARPDRPPGAVRRARSSAATALIGEVERSGLTGRGGAAYPAGKKLARYESGRDCAGRW